MKKVIKLKKYSFLYPIIISIFFSLVVTLTVKNFGLKNESFFSKTDCSVQYISKNKMETLFSVADKPEFYYLALSLDQFAANNNFKYYSRTKENNIYFTATKYDKYNKISPCEEEARIFENGYREIEKVYNNEMQQYIQRKDLFSKNNQDYLMNNKYSLEEKFIIENEKEVSYLRSKYLLLNSSEPNFFFQRVASNNAKSIFNPDFFSFLFVFMFLTTYAILKKFFFSRKK